MSRILQPRQEKNGAASREDIETADEVPIAIKTRAGLYARLESAIRRRHPYELPEIIAVSVTAGLPAYLDWIGGETTTPKE